ncbi:AI-2E family transporter [Muricoccus radiodurans]|uniref:AI-2E family transporter n=1 Tax=Muricoccus radiodurans TaxID=2231721 RepID=UPI003CF1C1A1
MRHAPITALILLAGLLVLAWRWPDVTLILFAGVLGAVALRAGAVPMARYFGIGEGWAVLLIVLLLFVSIGLGVWLGVGENLLEQARQAGRDLPRAWERLNALLRDLPGPEWLDRILEPAATPPSPERLVGVARAGLTTSLGAMANIVLILLLAIFMATDPGPYRRGALSLLAPSLRPCGERTLEAMGHVLRGWLIGQLFAMVVSGTLTFLGLWALGIPLAGLLAVLTAIFGFIPYLGPFIGMVPAGLITLSHDPSLLVWVIGLFLLVQNVEGYVLTPLVQQEASDVPAAVLLGAQALFGTTLGVLGILLAAPVAAAVVAAVRVAYVEGWVEREPEGGVPPPSLS